MYRILKFLHMTDFFSMGLACRPATNMRYAFILIVGGFNGFYGNGLIVGGFNGFYGNGLIVGGFNGFCGKILIVVIS